ncbi:MAG: ATP-binding cassette domain-containing protein [Hyphomicrobiales bacterium]
MGQDIESLKEQVGAFAKEHGTGTQKRDAKADLNPKPLARALSYICERFDHPVSAYAIEHTTVFADNKTDIKTLPVIGNAIGLDVTPFSGRLKRLSNAHLPAVAKTTGGYAVITSVDTERGVKGKVLTLSLFTENADDDAQDQTMPLNEFISQKSSLMTCKRDNETEKDAPVSVRGFFSSPIFSSEALFATIAINVIGLAIPLFTMNVYDKVLPNFSIDTLTVLALGVCLAALFDFLLRLLRTHIVDATSRRIDVLFLNRIFTRYLATALSKERRMVGSDANAFRDTDVIREFHSSASLAIFGDLPFIFLFVGVIAYIGGPLVFVTVAAIVLMLLVGLLVQRPLAKITEEAYQNTANRNTVLIETISGIETLKAMGLERKAAQKWEKAAGAQIRSGVKSRAYTNFAMSFMIFAQSLATVALVVMAVHLIIAGTISAGAMLACMIIQGRAMGPVSQMSGLILRLYQVKAAERALAEMQSRPLERRETSRFIKHPKIEGEVAYENVFFTYDDESKVPALKDVSLSIRKGEKIAVIGHSGSGKTTLLKLLAKLYTPDSGRIFLDGIGLSALDPSEVRRHIGWAGTDATLFAGTIRENLVGHMTSLTDDDLVEAVRTSGALSWINSQSHGFDTLLTEGGTNLSSGQRQTLVLARAIISKPPLLLLDEPTSNMDGRLERMVIDGFEKANRDHTLLVVTHRPSTFDMVDRIIVMDKGAVLFDGPKDKVLARLSEGKTPDRKVKIQKARTSKVKTARVTSRKRVGGAA